jgi:hypothetical protein
MSRSPPLRFLVLLLAGWGGIRTVQLTPSWWTSPAAESAPAPVVRAASLPRPAAPVFHAPFASETRLALAPPEPRRAWPARTGTAQGRARRPLLLNLAWELEPAAGRGRPRHWRRSARPGSPAPATDAPRWSFSAWSFLRRGDSAALAAGGMLGGSQAGARIAYRLNRNPSRPLALSARLTSPVPRTAGAEAALGLDWQPLRRLPLHLLAERRQRLGREGRSAFGLTFYGGVSDAPLGALRIDGYAQAGVVGARSRDRFADGALRISLPLGRRARLGAGAWAATQPGIARVDLGPQASLRLPLAGRNVSVVADWRQRLAGNARPGSGPTLTIATDF